MPLPLAYFLTWTCYGTRLHGHPEGSVDREHNIPHTPFLSPDAHREASNRVLMTGPIYVLSNEARDLVTETIRKHCQLRAWRALALNVRTTHVHVVVNCFGKCMPDPAMEQFKAWSTRKLRELEFANPDQRVWTEGGSTRWINTDDSLAKAIDYVMNQQ